MAFDIHYPDCSLPAQLRRIPSDEWSDIDAILSTIDGMPTRSAQQSFSSGSCTLTSAGSKSATYFNHSSLR